jgi:competence protein ComEC
MILYFNRVAPVGIIINIVAGLLAGIMMTCGFLTVFAAPVSAWVSSVFGQVVVAAHYLLVNAVVPFLSVPGASFRSPHYEGWGRLLYVAYYIPILMVALLLDRWRPVDVFLPISWLTGSRPTLTGLTTVPANVSELKIAGQPGSGRNAVIRRGAWRTVAHATLQTFKAPRLAGVTCSVLLVTSIAAINRPFSAIGRGKLTVYFLDVGQGDSALVVFPGTSTMLVDAGGEIHIGRSRNSPSDDYLQDDEEGPDQGFGDGAPGVGELVVSRFLWSIGLRKLDYTLATHAHEDHVGGFEDVLQNFRVGELFVGHSPYSSREFRRLSRRARAEHVRIGSMTRGDGFMLEGVDVEVLWPPPGGKDSQSGNNDSIVLHLKYGGVSFLLAGDIEGPAETSLCSSDSQLRADVLKVPHHGSKTSSTPQFLDRVNPTYAVISVGVRSRFGHPHPDVIGRYLDRGIELFETGRDGMVTAETDGHQLAINSYLGKTASHLTRP